MTRTRLVRLFATAALAALTALPAQADRLSLQTLSAYLEGITAAETTFTQINGDGSIATGTLAIKRPGRMRFDYNPPEEALVLASGGALFVIDRKLNAQPNTYPLSSTPLSLILARDVDLSRSGMVVAHGFDGTATVVTARDPERPELGTIQLKFTADPVELRQWVIEDAEGGTTTVILDALRPATLNDGIFQPDRS